MRSTRVIVTWVVVAWSGVVSAMACASGPCGHAAHAPADAELFVTLAGASREDWAFLSSVAVPASSVDDAWRTLAGELGFDEAEAFERLLGTRASLAVRGVWDGRGDWTAFFSTDLATAKRIRRELRATPRKIVGGRPVLGLAGGRFRMTELAHEGEVVLVLAPAEGAGGSLFDTVCRGEGADLGATERLVELRGLAGGGRYGAAMLLPEGKGWLAAGAARIGVVSELTLLGRLTDVKAPRHRFDPQGWEALFEGALFATVERAGRLFQEDDLGPLEAMRPLIEAMGPSAGDAAAVVIREGAKGGVAIAGAISMAGPEDRAARLDAGVSRLVTGIGVARGEGAWEHDFGGLYPRARRSVRFEDGFEMFWDYIGTGWQPGWVVLGTSGGLTTELSATARREAGELGLHVTLDGEGWETMPMAAWRSVGVARPAALVGAMTGSGGAAPEALARLGGLELVRWEVRDLPNGRVDGRLVVERAVRPTEQNGP